MGQRLWPRIARIERGLGTSHGHGWAYLGYVGGGTIDADGLMFQIGDAQFLPIELLIADVFYPQNHEVT